MRDRDGILCGLLVIAFTLGLGLWFEPKEKQRADQNAACRADGGVPVITADKRFACVKWGKP